MTLDGILWVLDVTLREQLVQNDTQYPTKPSKTMHLYFYTILMPPIVCFDIDTSLIELRK